MLYEPARAIVERYPLAKQPERLEPYATHTSRNVPVDKDLFKPKWPKGTETVKR